MIWNKETFKLSYIIENEMINLISINMYVLYL